MTVLWSADEIARATGGVVSEDFEVTGLSIDTRTLIEGDLFVPLKDVRDGHDFIDAAMNCGASGTLSDRAIDHPHVRVDDTMQALRALGQAGRDRCQARRIAVTGSVGKTSVKEALAVMLSAFGSTHKSLRSFNNHIGVPITLATMPEATEYAVFETGMNHAGELTDLSRQVEPHIAMITNVAGAHQANFASIDAIADAKAEIRHGLALDGILILNADNPYTPRIVDQSDGYRILFFGTAETSDVRIMSSDHHAAGGEVVMRIGDQDIKVTLNVSGQHWSHNAAACMAVAFALDLDLEKAARALRDVQASEGRGDTYLVQVFGKEITLIDESYNANPASMRAAFSAASLRKGRKLAVLADMYELGPDELAQHAGLASPLKEAGFSRIITLGECMRSLRGALARPLRAAHADNLDDIEAAIAEELEDGDVLLIKGSNSTGLGKLAAKLKAQGER